jgi:putative ATP-dependent endonuclease of the OLD family
MHLSSVTIKNFRAIRDQTVRLDALTSIVGANGYGKSTVLAALNIFFRNTRYTTPSVTTLSIEDFHAGNTGDPIEISVTFIDLSPEAAKEFEEYVRDAQLTVTARAAWNPDTGQAPVVQRGARLAIEAFAPFFKAQGNGAKVAELLGIYGDLRLRYPDLDDVKTGPKMTESLRAYESTHPEERVLLHSDDEFYGFAGNARLEKFVQWVFVPAVRDAASEQADNKSTALGQLLDRTIRGKVDFEKLLAPLRTWTCPDLVDTNNRTEVR